VVEQTEYTLIVWQLSTVLNTSIERFMDCSKPSLYHYITTTTLLFLSQLPFALYE